MNERNIIWQAKFLRKKNWLEAVKLLEGKLKEEPDRVDIAEELADIYISKKLYKKAIENLNKARELNNNDSNTVFRLGNCYLYIKEPHIAINYYEMIEKTFPEVLYNKAIAYSRVNKKDIAIETLEQLTKLYPDTELAYYFLVEQYIYKKLYDKAITTLETAEKFFGKQGKIFFLKGLNFFYKQIWLKAFNEFQSAEKLKYENSNFYRIYGLCSEKIGNTEKAIELLNRAIKKEPFNSSNYIDLANIFVVHDRIDEALEIVKAARKIDPASMLITLTLNRILKALKKNK